MLTQAQIDARKGYIGSSDAKIIASGDMAKWQQLADEKRGVVQPHFSKDVLLKMSCGSHLESWIADEWQNMQSLPVEHRGIGKSIMFGEVPLHSTFDGLTHGKVPVEIKSHFGFMDMDELCELYAPQCQHHMITSGKDKCILVVWFGVRCQIKWRTINSDPLWRSAYLDEAFKFWRMYQNGEDFQPTLLPPVDYDDMYVIEDMRSMEDWTEEDDSTFRMAAFDIASAKAAVSLSDEAKELYKGRLPKGCRKMELALDGNMSGHKVRVSRTKSGTVTCTLVEPKKELNDD